MTMSAVTRRAFLRSSGLGLGGLGLGGLGLGVLAGGGLGGCATAMKGDFAPKKGRRVVVIGGGWGGATAAKYVRLDRPEHRGRPDRAQPGVHLLPVQQPRAGGVRTIGSITMGYDGLRKHGVQDDPRDGQPPSSPIRSACGVGEGYLRVRPARRLPGHRVPVGAGRGARPEPGQGAPRLEGGAADRAARAAAGQRCPTAASSCSPSRPWRTGARPAPTSASPGRLVSQDEQAASPS